MLLSLQIEEAQEKGRKLGILIASLKITDEEREAMLSLLPHMTETQLENFIQALEINYLQAMTQDQDKKLAEDLQKVDEVFQAKVAQINANTNKELDFII